MRVLIIDDHALFRSGLSLLLKEFYEDMEVLQASTLNNGIETALTETLNVVFLDLDLPDGHGFTALAELKNARPSLPIIVTSADQHAETVVRCIELNAMGYVTKTSSPEALQAAIGAVLNGGVFLPATSLHRTTQVVDSEAGLARHREAVAAPANKVATSKDLKLAPREFECLEWVSRGLPTKTIATRMGVEDITVRKYVSNLLAHFNVKRRTELIVFLAAAGIKFGTPPATGPTHDAPKTGHQQFDQQRFDIE